MLRESRDHNAFKIKQKKIDNKFNLNADGFDQGQLDKTSQLYFNKIMEVREMQKQILPLYMGSQEVINKHKKCLSTILKENREVMPQQLLRVVSKGETGL